MKWKNKLKMILAETTRNKKTEICLENALTKTDETQFEVVSSVFVSDELAQFPENSIESENALICSNCGLEMNLIENNTLWFCPLGCESRKIN